MDLSFRLSKFFGKIFFLLRGLFIKVLSIVFWPSKKCYQMVVTIFVFLADYFLDKARTAAQKALLFWLVLFSLVIAAVLSYLAFYSTYVPTAEIRKPVHLSFSVCPSGTGICSFPSANVSFWNEEGTRQDFLGAGQAYSMTLTLEVPESSRNRDLGMFVIVVKMFDRNGMVSLTSERSTMLRYMSIISRVLDFLGWMPLYFFGFKEHKQTLSVMMFPHLVDDYYHPSVGARVEIRSHGLEIYSCMLILAAKFTGLKYYLYYWPVTSTMFAFLWNFIIFAMMLGFTMYKRSSDMKALAVTLDLARKKKVLTRSKKDGYEEKAKDDSFTEDDEDATSALTTSGTPTMSSTKNTEGNEDSDSFDIPLVQEPVDFIPEGEEDAVGLDLINELRQRRIN
ncbi:hypothetical protein EGW08_011910 [Elysia chlorotica]|uniref:Seipin n=1 Tax=Elysia chlorotica TaxID=188477 RepID=A0A3S1BCI8_ELYCH|nr:hypothetical protein EGW08_011910 [Elysia chlorotica]